MTNRLHLVLIWMVGCSVLGMGQATSYAVLKFDAFRPMLQQQNDTTYVINFWATWCKPCVEEMPLFYQVASEYAPADKVQFIMVSLDFPKQLDTKLTPFLKKNKVPGRVIVLDAPDYNNWIPLVEPTWDGAIPVTYIYKNKQHVFLDTSIEHPDELKKLIKQVNE